MQDRQFVERVLDPDTAYVFHATGYYGNNYSFTLREIAAMPVRVGWYFEPPRLAHYVIKQSAPSTYLYADARKRFESYVVDTQIDWNTGEFTLPSVIQKLRTCVRPGQTVYCATPLLAGIAQTLFPMSKALDIHDVDCLNLGQYVVENWHCPYATHKDNRSLTCVMPKLSQMYQWFYLEPETDSDESGIEM